jgi:hypothetical protein
LIDLNVFSFFRWTPKKLKKDPDQNHLPASKDVADHVVVRGTTVDSTAEVVQLVRIVVDVAIIEEESEGKKRFHHKNYIIDFFNTFQIPASFAAIISRRRW